MDEITAGGKAFKEAWAALPKQRKREITKAVQAGHSVPEQTEIALGYAQRQIKTSWAGYVGIIALAFIINLIQGEDIVGSPLTWAILGAIVVIAVYSYWRLFTARDRNRELLETRSEGAAEPDALSRMDEEGGPVPEGTQIDPSVSGTPAMPSVPPPMPPVPPAAPQVPPPGATGVTAPPAPNVPSPPAPQPTTPDLTNDETPPRTDGTPAAGE